jgi:hypothetical protein
VLIHRNDVACKGLMYCVETSVTYLAEKNKNNWSKAPLTYKKIKKIIKYK